MIGNDWRLEFPEEESNELMHYGKKGMKWGKRNAAGSTAAPSVARAALLGGYGGLQRESRYKNAEALKNRKAAGKNISRGLLTSLGGVALTSLSGATNNQALKAGAGIVGKLLTTAGTVQTAVGAAQNIASTVQENKSRQG